MDQSTSNDQLLTDICDSDPLWGPLLFMRPRPEEKLGVLRLLATCAAFGGFYGLCLDAVLSVLRLGRHMPPLYAAPLFLTVTSFICGQLSFAPAWNRRALSIGRRKQWEEATHSSARERTRLAKRCGADAPPDSDG